MDALVVLLKSGQNDATTKIWLTHPVPISQARDALSAAGIFFQCLQRMVHAPHRLYIVLPLI